jgi:hypothetical protein
VQSDVLLRVLACEIGDDAFFEKALGRYCSTRASSSRVIPSRRSRSTIPASTIASTRTAGAGRPISSASSARRTLSSSTGRHVELTWAQQPILSAQFKATRFAQTLSPFTGKEGFTEVYSPSILCLIDFVERLCGILPRPDGALWFTGLVPHQIEHRDASHETAYCRVANGHRFELVNTASAATAYRDGALLFQCPKGVRVVTDRSGKITSLIGMSVNEIEGSLRTREGALPFRVAANEQLDLREGRLVSVKRPGLVPPTY